MAAMAQKIGKRWKSMEMRQLHRQTPGISYQSAPSRVFVRVRRVTVTVDEFASNLASAEQWPAVAMTKTGQGAASGSTNH
eukprot:s235_g25.t1